MNRIKRVSNLLAAKRFAESAISQVADHLKALYPPRMKVEVRAADGAWEVARVACAVVSADASGVLMYVRVRWHDTADYRDVPLDDIRPMFSE